jgi:tRNA(Arg) A34 adenosine deaminase TadA
MDEEYIREAIGLARDAVAQGNTPFGSLLVIDDSVIERSTNTTRTDDDITAHPELKLARWAARELTPSERRKCTMYTSTEPCEMCAAAINRAGLKRVVYSVASDTLAELRGDSTSGIRSTEVIERNQGSTIVDGPVLESEGLKVHEEFY